MTSHAQVYSGIALASIDLSKVPIPVVGAYLRALTVAAGSVWTGIGVYNYRWVAYPQFYALVGDRQTWDFKHRIEERLGQGITLCDGLRCANNVEYSVPGNVHFGFVASAAGYTSIETQAGAAFAERTDPAHDPQSSYYKEPYGGRVEVYPLLNLGDNPEDNRAVLFGINLYGKYAKGRALTFPAFQLELGNGLPNFAQHSADPRPVPMPYAGEWPYWVGYFDPTKP